MKFNKKNAHLSEDVQRTIFDNQYEEAISTISQLLEKDNNNAELFFERGKLLWRLGRKAEAMSDYAAAAHLDPNSPAVTALEMARDVMDFYNRDMYNP